jgi:hypothetical protein
MRKLVLIALIAVASVLVLPTGPAVAGGPTSVLVVNHDGSRAAAALTGSTAYDELASSLDVWNPPSGETREPGDFMNTSIRLTWMIHDVNPWRTDGIVVDGETFWVSTVVNHDGSHFDQPAVWHRPKDPALLRATLTEMGILGSAPTSTPDTSTATTPSQAAAATRPGAATTTAPGSSGVPFPLAATIGLLGVALGALVAGPRPLHRRSGRADPRPPEASPEVHLPPKLPVVDFTDDPGGARAQAR